MNYCRKCQSDYEKPGTCNCFAPTRTSLPSEQPSPPLPAQSITFAFDPEFERKVVRSIENARSRGKLRA